MKHKHLGIPNHSPAQAAKFFAEANDMQLNPTQVKERAVKYWKVECFNQLTVSQLSELIEKLVQKHEDVKNKQIAK